MNIGLILFELSKEIFCEVFLYSLKLKFEIDTSREILLVVADDICS